MLAAKMRREETIQRLIAKRQLGFTGYAEHTLAKMVQMMTVIVPSFCHQNNGKFSNLYIKMGYMFRD